jgi:hypothetical protein
MRRLFLVLAKLVGLTQAFRAFMNLIQMGSVVNALLGSSPAEASDASLYGSMVGVFVSFPLSLALAWLLLFRTEQVADFLRVGPDEPFPAFRRDVLLNVGVKMIGLYLAAEAIPSLARWLFEARYFAQRRPNFHITWTGILQPALALVVGIVLIAKTRQIVALIARDDETPGHEPRRTPRVGEAARGLSDRQIQRADVLAGIRRRDRLPAHFRLAGAGLV